MTYVSESSVPEVHGLAAMLVLTGLQPSVLPQPKFTMNSSAGTAGEK